MHTQGNADIEALMRAWSGLRDTSETVTVGEAPLPSGERERRISTVVAPVQLPWLGPHVLYLEDAPYDESDAPLRQLLVRLEPLEEGGMIRARLFTFNHPARWMHLDRRPRLAARLTSQDLQNVPGCDLLFTRMKPQFRASTRGRQCRAPLDAAGGAAFPGAMGGLGIGGSGAQAAGDFLYVDYQLLLDASVYWYRRRLIRASDGEIVGEAVGFNWFELNDARLFSCRVDWSASGRNGDLRPLTKLDLHDKGGHGEFTTPDGRHLLLTLHSQDWPFAAEQDSLVLVLSEAGASGALASSWAVVDDTEISLRVPGLAVRCGAIVSSQDEVRG